MARTKATARGLNNNNTTRSLPRLPSGVYFSLPVLPDAAANEASHVPEYPTFPSLRGAQGGAASASASAGPAAPGETVDLPYRPAPAPGTPQPQPQLCLPLADVSISMQVDHSTARTSLVQTFQNPAGGSPIPEARYSFPLYDGATVTAFRCSVGGGRVLEGRVLPAGEARREFARAALERQEAAALVEELTPEVFQTTVGNIAPGAAVRVEITYVEELRVDLGGGGVLVTIPTSVAPRYGTPPQGYKGKSTPTEPRLDVVVSVASSSAEKPIVCRSGHDIKAEYEETNPGSQEGEEFEDLASTALEGQPGMGTTPKRATVRMSDKTAMDKDLILFVPSPDENPQRSLAVLAPSAAGAPGGQHSALRVTVRPSELFSDLRESMAGFDGEVLFLADRSGSMAGPKIEELRNALFVFVKSLPPGCRFNLYSFGSDVSGLWGRSVPYGEAAVQDALDHISTFQADFGGTEVLRALKKAVGDRRSAGQASSSTQVILLTDGEIWQAEETIEFVRMNTAKADGQLRFFSMGLGTHVSHQLIQGIGMFGGGFGEVASVDAAGRWKEAVIRILKGAIMPNSWSYSISIGDGWDEKRLDVDDVFPGKVAKKPSGPSFVQAPRNIPLLHHYGQQSVYFLLDASSDKFPEQVTITASSQYGGTKTATLKVTRATPNNTTIHHLAARTAVRDLESQDVPDAISSDIIRSNAEHLCQAYSITSKWASFVAVSHLQEEEESVDDEYVEVSVYKAPMADPALLPTSTFERVARRKTQGMQYMQYMQGMAPRKQLASKAARKSAPSSSTSLMPVKKARMVSPGGVCDLDYEEPTEPDAPADNPSSIPWQDVVRHQRIDGLFDLDKSVANRLGTHFCPGTQQALTLWAKKHAADDTKGGDAVGLLASTVMALAYLRSHFYPDRALWELLVQKAEGSIASRLAPGQWDRSDGLSALADSALAHAHYGSLSQDGAKGDWWVSGPKGGRCGVCKARSGQKTRLADGGPSECSFSGCGVPVSPWDQFWTHAIEQGHINSSCRVANGQSEAADGQQEKDGRRRSQRLKMANEV
ncbi:hypothetical protein KVR01_008264 [Diaporthe batatas]|uniref:uncharacterized protein n=1 Tax=Diaporthe batatas TaxID=748121 RepID=UPI001D03F87E|nr:uncharacterized protein KVR01_008264 [Diaporthe batatas]KAG8162499.1 hypothetical protein KVR01_008264 [Diaporthe batatas]